MNKRKERILKGLCPECGGIKDREGYACKECTNKGNLRKSTWAKNRIREGFCPHCGDRTLPQKPYCQKCKNKILAKNKLNKYPSKYTARDLLRIQKKRAEWKEKGLCQGCGKKMVDKYYCDECIEKMRIRGRRFRENYKKDIDKQQ